MLWGKQMLHISWITSATIAGFVVIIKLASVLQFGGDYPDPFTRYDAIMPGQPASALNPYHCQMIRNRLNGEIIPEHLTCMLLPKDGVFDIIAVDILNSQIKAIAFYVSNVELGDILLHWRPSDNIQVTRSNVRWRNKYDIEVTGRDLKYHSQVQIIWVTSNSNYVPGN